MLDEQRVRYQTDRQVDHVVRMLEVSADDPTFGYQINNYRHCLQTATMVMRAGHDGEAVTVALLHDIGFTACPSVHGEFAAALLEPYVSERHVWMLRHHAIFQQIHLNEYPGLDPDERDRWVGHEHFDWTAEFVAEFDQRAIDPGYPTEPIQTFLPAVREVFARP